MACATEEEYFRVDRIGRMVMVVGLLVGVMSGGFFYRRLGAPFLDRSEWAMEVMQRLVKAFSLVARWPLRNLIALPTVCKRVH